MREYETTLIIQPEISDDGIAALCERLDGVLEKGGASRLLYDDLGKRRLAYEIQNFQKGRYVMLQFLDTGVVVSDVERALRLEDSVIRFMTVQVDDFVADVPARKAQAVEQEKIRAQKAAERAAREAEEAARQAAEEAARQEAEEAARRAAAEQPEAEKASPSADDETPEAPPEAKAPADAAAADSDAAKEVAS